MTIHVHLPVSAPVAQISSITISEVGGGGHNAPPVVHTGPFTSGTCPPGCPGNPSNPSFSLICGATGFHNGAHTITVAGTAWTFPGPPPLFMTPKPIEGSISVDIANLVVTATQPANPEPILWHADPGEVVQLRATASSAYRALQPVKLRIYRSDQTPVKTIETSTVIGPGITELPFTWDGSQDPPLEGTAEPGVYLFTWEVGGPGQPMDADQDKSSGITITGSGGAEMESNDGTSATYSVTYTLTSVALRPASEGRIEVYDPELGAFGARAIIGSELDPGTHTVQISMPSPTCAGTYTFLVQARDNHADLDRAHRTRWALQHNQRIVLAPAACFGFSKASTSGGATTAWTKLAAGRFANNRVWRPYGRALTTQDPKNHPPEPRVDKKATEGWYALAWSRWMQQPTVWFFFGHGFGGSHAGKAIEFAEKTALVAGSTTVPGYTCTSLSALPPLNVEIAVIAACKGGWGDAPGDHESLAGALRARGAQNTITFNRRMNTAIAGRWCELFWRYATIGSSSSLKHAMDWRSAAWQAQERTLDSFSRRGIGVYFLNGSLDAFVKYNGELMAREN